MEKSDEFCFLYSTFPDTESAHTTARTLIALHLAACVNVYPPMKSFYIWQGKTEEEQEVSAFIKTRRSLVQKAVAAIRPMHPYSVPCFLVLPIEEGAEDYLAWARRQTEGRRHAARFTWSAYAQSVAEVYRRLAGESIGRC